MPTGNTFSSATQYSDNNTTSTNNIISIDKTLPNIYNSISSILLSSTNEFIFEYKLPEEINFENNIYTFTIPNSKFIIDQALPPPHMGLYNIQWHSLQNNTNFQQIDIELNSLETQYNGNNYIEYYIKFTVPSSGLILISLNTSMKSHVIFYLCDF